jgi:hypothetical protein
VGDECGAPSPSAHPKQFFWNGTPKSFVNIMMLRHPKLALRPPGRPFIAKAPGSRRAVKAMARINDAVVDRVRGALWGVWGAAWVGAARPRHKRLSARHPSIAPGASSLTHWLQCVLLGPRPFFRMLAKPCPGAIRRVGGPAK